MFIDDSYVDNIQTKDLVDLGQSMQGVSAGRITFVTVPTGSDRRRRQRGPAHRRHACAVRRDHQRRSAPAGEERRQHPGAGHDATTAGATPAPTEPAPRRRLPRTPSSSTPSPPVPATSRCACRTRPVRTDLRPRQPTNSSSTASTSPPPTTIPGPLTSTTVFFSAGNEQAAATVASSFANPTIERVSGHGRRRAGSARTGLQIGGHRRSPSGSPVQVHVLHGASKTAPPTAAGGPDGHQRRRHHLRVARQPASGRWHSPFVHRQRRDDDAPRP